MPIVAGRSRRCIQLALLVALSLGGCKKAQEKAPPPPPLVKVTEVVQRDVPIYLEAVGQTRGNTEIEISARVEGFLETMTFKEGSFVKKGQVLYTIDNRPFKAAVAEAHASLAQSQAELVRKHQDVERYAPLVEKNAVSRQEFETAVAQEKAQKAAVAASQAAAQKAQVELSYTTVVAPDDGLIGTTEAHPGTLVGTAQKPLLTHISKIDPIHVRFSISERDYLFFARRRGAQHETEPAAASAPDAGTGAAATRPASAADGKADAGAPDAGASDVGGGAEFELILADGSVHPQKGKLVFIDRNVDAKTGTIRIEAEFPNPKNIVRPGQYARVRAAPTVKKGAILVEQRSVQELQGLYNVAVVKADDSVEIRPVKTADRVGDLVIIESGLKPGERVIVEGLQKLRPGIKVKPELVPFEEAKPPGAPSSAPSAPAPAASGG
jgi:membrane fusion protein (multidrug efflux system)